MKRDIVVVGAGIVGLTAAYFAAKRGDNVTLIEASDQAGGLLRSTTNQFGSFDFGTHIASASNVEALDDFLFSHPDNVLHPFTIQESGSFFNGKFSQCSPFMNLNGLPDKLCGQACKELVTAPKVTECIPDNLEQAIREKFGDTAYTHGYLPFVRTTFGEEPANLPSYYINFFDMYRVIAFDQSTSEQLKSVDYINDRIGFQQHTPGVNKYYPVEGGIGAWTQQLIEKVADAGVDIRLSTKVSEISTSTNGVHLTFENESIDASQLIWTVSSALLSFYLPLKTRLKRPKFRATALVDFVFESPLHTSCKYINNFDSTFISTRLTCYQNLTPNSQFYGVTVEVLLDELMSEALLINKVTEELVNMGITTPDNMCCFSQSRTVAEGFPVITCENHQLLTQLNTEIGQDYPAITLLGRSSSKGFFMSELLAEAYRLVK